MLRCERVGRAEMVDGDGMVDRDVDRQHRVEARRIAAGFGQRRRAWRRYRPAPGTQVVSCISTRPGTNAISASLAPLASHPRMAALAASPSGPVPLRSTFSSNSRMSQGRRARSAPALPGRSTKRSRRPLCGKDWMDVVLIAASLAPHQRVYAIFAYKQQEKQQCIIRIWSIASVLHCHSGAAPTGPAFAP